MWDFQVLSCVRKEEMVKSINSNITGSNIKVLEYN